VLLALGCCCPERPEIVSVLPFPKVWKETIDSTRVYSSVVGWPLASSPLFFRSGRTTVDVTSD